MIGAFIGLGLCMTIPCYMTFNAKALQSEARKELPRLYREQAKYHDRHGKYARSFDELGYRPALKQYSITFNKDYIKGEGPRAQEMPDHYKLIFKKSRWNAFASSNLDSDADVDVWMIDSDGTLYHLQNDAGIPFLERHCGTGVYEGN